MAFVNGHSPEADEPLAEDRINDALDIPVRSEGDVLRGRQFGRSLAEALGFDGIRTATIEIAVSELGLNLVKHRTIEGRLCIRARKDANGVCMEVVAEDQGPGIADPVRAMEDGVSSAGSLGIGLSGVRRMMDEFKLEQRSPLGTRVMARKWLYRHVFPKFGFSVFSRAVPGEKESGDVFFLKHQVEYSLFGIVDALGHGSKAHDTARLALNYLESCCESSLEAIFAGCHGALKGSRGAAMALAKLENATLRLRYLSVGNIELRLYDPDGVRKLDGRYGTLGLSCPPLAASVHQLARRTIAVMFSDGIQSHFDIPRDVALRREQNIAWHIFETFAKKYDDATVVVAKMRA